MKKIQSEDLRLHDTRKQKGVAAWVLAILIFVFVGTSGAVFWSNKGVKKDLEEVKQKIESKEEAIKKRTSGKTAEDHLNSLAVIESALTERVEWSGAQREIVRLQKLLRAKMRIVDYDGAQDLSFSLEGVAPDLDSVGVVIESFQSSNEFVKPFVTSITKKETSEYTFNGIRPREVYQFQLVFDFTPSEK